MKGKILKISTVITLILTMTMINFLYVGNSIVSYAIDNISTNNNNVEFGVYFKDDNGNKVSSLETEIDSTNMNMYLYLKVKQEGYFNGKVTLNEANFKLKDTQNEYINKIDGNVINLNQINAGKEVEIELPIEFIKNENFDLNLLNMESKILLEGIYRDSSERDKQIKSNKTIKLQLMPKNDSSQNIDTTAEIITNKTLTVGGEGKRVVQILLNVGLKDNSYPIEKLNINMTVPSMNNEQPEAYAVANLNTMKEYSYNYENGQININMKNDKSENNEVLWKNRGNEAIVLTYLYKVDEIEDINISGKVEMSLYNNTSIDTEIPSINVNKNDEKEEVVSATIKESEESIAKGKLYQGIDREYTTKDTISVNATNIVNYLEIKENDVFSIATEEKQQETEVNQVYKKTVLNKDQLFNIIGENGRVIVKNSDGEYISVITKDTQADENGNIVIDYGAEGQTGISIKTTAPVNTGKLDITNNKVIKANDTDLIKDSNSLKTQLFVTTNLNENQGSEAKEISNIELKDTVTEAGLEINKADLSTVIENDIELKALLKSKNESNDLYKNPTLNIEFPEQVEEIKINDISLLYDEELRIKDYDLNGRVLTVRLEGEQTNYTENAVEGTIIVINGKVKLNKKAATADSQIVMSYSNEKAKAYANDAKAAANVKVVAPTDVTTVTTIEQLNIEEVNQNGEKEIMLQRGTSAKEITPQIEVINNKPVTIKDVKVLGSFPTGENEDSVGIDITSQINTENAKVYYSENENATDDLSNTENAWSETIQDESKVKKYLIATDELASGDSIIANYNAVIPENLEYNENASQDYQVTYTDSTTNLSDTVKSTKLSMTTGTGPKLEAKVTGTVGNDELKDGSQVKSGEVIKYKIQVSNTGTETAKNVTISAPVPEGTTYVQAKEEFDCTGASYYVESDKQKCEEVLSEIKPGEVVTREYEVRVNKNITDETNITDKCTAKFDDVITESNELKSVLKNGDIRISVKRITSDGVTLYKDMPVKYYVLVENMSSETKTNVKVQTSLSEGAEVADNTVSLITGNIDEELTNKEDLNETDITYSNEMDIGDFAPGEMKLLYYGISSNKPGEQKVSVIAKQGNDQYRSNVWQENIQERKVEISMVSNQSKYVKSGDTIEYTITVKNTGTDNLKSLAIQDEINNYLKITSITEDGETAEIPDDNLIISELDIDANKEKVVKVTTTVMGPEDNETAVMLSNKALAEYQGEEIGQTEEITHIIQPTEQNPVDDDSNNNNNNNSNSNNSSNNDSTNNNTATGTKIVSGMAWYDTNSDGKKDDNETTLSDITVNLLNAETNELVKDKDGNVLSTKTSENGTYMLSNIQNGKYIVIFNYNTTEYAVTKYKAAGVDETRNSNAMMNNVTLDGATKKIASTDIIQVDNNNISDINIGLIKVQNFDLKLEKFVNKILVQNASGTTVKEYNDSTIAKLELPSKQINNTTVIIEYKIKVTNVGEVEGYVKKVADYMPGDLKFSSELNKDWYQTGSDLYNTSLANTKLAAGESKELTLTLSKTMTNDNTGLINNMAEIAESYNELGLEDSNSTPGNKTQGENDMGSADVIISIKTGEIIFYTSMIVIVVIAILSAITIPIVKKSKQRNKTNHKFDKI